MMQTLSLSKGAFESIASLVGKLAAAKAATLPPRPPRLTLLSAAQAAASAGTLPPLLVFQSKRNASYNAHAQALHQLAAAGDLAGLTAYPVKGTNTYARALARYRTVLADYLSAAAPPAAPEEPEALEKPVAKKKPAAKTKPAKKPAAKKTPAKKTPAKKIGKQA